MVDDFIPRLSMPAVREMAVTMRTDQQKEIAEFERKVSSR